MAMRTTDIIARALAACRRLMTDERIIHAEITGSVRRGVLEVNDLDLLIVTRDPADFPQPPARPRRPECEAHVYVATPDTYGAILAFSTGPRELNAALRRRADATGYVFGCDGKTGACTGLLTRGGAIVPTRTEEEFFRLIGVPHVPPSFRSWLASNIDHL